MFFYPLTCNTKSLGIITQITQWVRGVRSFCSPGVCPAFVGFLAVPAGFLGLPGELKQKNAFISVFEDIPDIGMHRTLDDYTVWPFLHIPQLFSFWLKGMVHLLMAPISMGVLKPWVSSPSATYILQVCPLLAAR